MEVNSLVIILKLHGINKNIKGALRSESAERANCHIDKGPDGRFSK